MPKITFIFKKKINTKIIKINAKPGKSILDVALLNNINIEHFCQKSCACATCHCIVKKGFDSLNKISDLEYDMLEKAWGIELNSRLSCQAIVGEKELIIEIPKHNNYYTT